MAYRIRVAALALILAIVACGPLGGANPVPNVQSGPPSPTPPPIPTRPQATPTVEGEENPDSGEPQAADNQTMTIVYGSSRGMSLGIYFLSINSEYVATQAIGDTVRNAVWPAPSPDGAKIAFVSVQSDLLINGIF